MAPSGTTEMSTKVVEDTEAIDRAIMASQITEEWSTKTVEDTDAIDRAILLSQVPISSGRRPPVTQIQDQNGFITLKVKPTHCSRLGRGNSNGNEINFRGNMRMRFRKLMELYAQKVGFPVSSLIFTFHGRQLCDEDTPRALEMREGNIIEVYCSTKHQL